MPFSLRDKGTLGAEQRYDHTAVINSVRQQVDQWRKLPNTNDWRVTPETARLLQHWRHHNFSGIRPFFCQIEAVETAIWLIEVAPQAGKAGEGFLDHLANSNNDANPELMRLALKLATGAGKTTVMAMLIAWQTINAVRRPQSKRFTRGFLVVAPGLTIKDRLRVLQPNDPDSYYASRELVPGDMLDDVNRAKIVITNFHAFKLRERIDLSKGGRSLLQGRGDELNTPETEGQMLQRVMPDLMGMKNILVLNDEAHHCYREKPDADEDGDLKGDDKKEAEKNNEAARLWISGFEVPYRYGSETRRYPPDFVVRVEDGHGEEDLLNLIVEIKGYRHEHAKEKKSTMDTYWVPGVNNLGTHGRWAFAEFTEVYQIETDFAKKVEAEFNKMIHSAVAGGRSFLAA